MTEFSDSTQFLTNLGSILVDNLNIRALILVHTSATTLNGLFQGLKFQQANIREQAMTSTGKLSVGVHMLIL